MNTILLRVKRPFNVRAYLLLVVLLIPAAFAIYPFLHTTGGVSFSSAWDLIISAGINLLLYAVLGAAGLWLATRTGLGIPLIEGWTAKEPTWNRLRGVVGIAILAAIFLILFKGLDVVAAAILDKAAPAQAGAAPTNPAVPSFWQGLLAAFSAGITEETMFRLFGLTLLAWLGSLIFRSRSGRPALWLLWTANILFALLFGAAHLLTASQSGVQMDAVIVIRTLLVNGMGGIVFGWLYWTFGLESAMLAHFSADLIRYGLVPLVTQQADPTWRIVIGAAVVLVVACAGLWSVGAIRRDQKQFTAASEPGALLSRAGYSHPAA